MDIFTQKKLLVRSVVILAVFNILSVGIFWWKISNSENDHAFEEEKEVQNVAIILEKELNLTKDQVAQVRKLREIFFEKERVLHQSIKSKRDSMNQLMFNKTTDENTITTLTKGVADDQFQMEWLRYEQSKDFKAICTPEQLEKFEDLVKEIKRYFKPNNDKQKKKH